MSIEIVAQQHAYATIKADHVPEQVFQTLLECLKRIRTHGGGPLGFLIVLARAGDSDEMICTIMGEDTHNSWKGNLLADHERRAAQLLSLNGGTLLDCESGRVRAATVHFASRASCPFVLDGHGTKHQTAVNLSFNWDVVVMVQSFDSSDVTIFSPALTRSGKVTRLRAPPWPSSMPRSMPVNRMQLTEARVNDAERRTQRHSSLAERIGIHVTTLLAAMFVHSSWLQLVQGIVTVLFFWKLQASFQD